MVRFGQNEPQKEPVGWSEVDRCILESIKADSEIFSDQGELLFIDRIIKCILMRAFCNAMQRKYITAQRILQMADTLLCHLESNPSKPQDLEYTPLPTQILRQRYYFFQGLLELHLENYE